MRRHTAQTSTGAMIGDMHPTTTPTNLNILTTDLLNYGLPQRTAFKLVDYGHWRLAHVLKIVNDWNQHWRRTSNGEMALHEYLAVAGFGPGSAQQLLDAFQRRDRLDRSQAWAPSPEVWSFVDSITGRIDDGRIAHGDLLPSAGSLAADRVLTISHANTAYRLLAVRGYVARRGGLTVALMPGEIYTGTFSDSISAQARLFAHEALELLRHNPGLPHWHRLRAPLRAAVAPIGSAVWNDPARRFVVTKVGR